MRTLAVFQTGMHPRMHVLSTSSHPNICTHTHAHTRSQALERSPSVRLTVAAVPELSVLGDLQFGGVGGRDAVAGLHAVALLQLRQGAHQTGVGGVQRRDTLLLQPHTHINLVRGTSVSAVHYKKMLLMFINS